MLLGDGPRDGKPQAVPAGAARARLVRAVKAIKHVRKVLGRYGRAGVAHRKPRLLSRARKRHVHRSPVVDVLASVVDERARQTAQPLLVAAQLDAGLHLRFQPHTALERHRFELQDLAFDDVGQVDFLEGRARGAGLRGGLLLVHLRQREQIAHQALHGLGLVLRALEPLALACHAALGMLERDGRVGKDDGERGLQVVRRVRHEAALLRPGAGDGTQRPAAEEQADDEEHGQRRDLHHGKRCRQGTPAARAAHVGERQIHDAARLALHIEQAQVGQAAEALVGAGELFAGLLEHILADGCRVIAAERGHGPVRGHGEQRHGDDLPPAALAPADGRRRGGIGGVGSGKLLVGGTDEHIRHDILPTRGRVDGGSRLLGYLGRRFPAIGRLRIARPTVIGRVLAIGRFRLAFARRVLPHLPALMLGGLRDGLVERTVDRGDALPIVHHADGREDHRQHNGDGGHVQRYELDAELFQHRMAALGRGAVGGETVARLADGLDAGPRAQEAHLLAQEADVCLDVVVLSA